MDLKKFLPGQSKEEVQPEYFWSIIVEPGWVQAGIWRISGETAQVIHGSTPYPWELEEELVNAADTALAGAIAGFPEGIEEPSKTVFGVISPWVSEGQIKDEQLEKIKRICSDLSLTPIGFVVIPEAISHLLKSEEKTPLNAILVGVYRDILEVSVYKLGNLLGTSQVTRSLSIIDDVTEGISRFAKGDASPSRIILYGGKDGELEDTKHSLNNVSWGSVSTIQFLHDPKIELFGSQKKVDAVSLAGASEVSGVSVLLGQGDVPQEENSEEEIEELENITEVKPEDVGFVVDGDVEPEAFAHDPSPFSRNFGTSTHEESSYEEIESNETKNFTEVFNKFHMPALKMPKLSVGQPMIIGLVLFVILLIGALAAWWYIPKAVVTIYISPKQLNEHVEVTVDPSTTSSNEESKILAGETIETSVKGEKTAQTTGTKTVGEKATGTVTLYRVGSALSLKAGTFLRGPNSLRFLLDEDVDVESGTASSPSEVSAKVIAETIGAEYNLAKDSSFTVGNYTASDIEAINVEDFSGGSSREISAVSESDQKNLEKELTTELQEQAKEELNTTLSETDIFISDSLATTSSSKEFSAKVGDEAKSIGLKMTIDGSAVTVKKSELFALAQKSVAEKVPDGFVLREDQINTEFTFTKKEGKSYKFDVTVSANLLPEIETTEIAQKIRGKNLMIAQEYLTKEVSGFSRAEIVLKPRLPGKLGTLPQVTKNIEVEVAAER